MDVTPRQVILYVTEADDCPFEDWIEGLRNRQARAKIKKRIDRVSLGNLGDCKAVGDGVLELRVNYGPGYRVYFSQSEKTVILLLCGGDKSTQNQDIATAKAYWKDFQRREDGNS